MFVSKKRLKAIEKNVVDLCERAKELEKQQRWSTVDRPTDRSSVFIGGSLFEMKGFAPCEVIEMILRHLKMDLIVTPGQPKLEECGRLIPYPKKKPKGKQ